MSWLRRFGTALTIFGAIGWPETTCASFEFSRETWDSMSDFLALARSELGQDRVVLGARLDWSQLTPADAVLIVHPTVRIEFAEASAFLSAGGRLALVDDYGKGDELLARFHIQRGFAPEPAEMLNNNPKLAVARPYVHETESGSTLRHPIVKDVQQVVTNHPTALSTKNDIELTTVLTLEDAKAKAHAFAVIGVIGDAAACGLSPVPARGKAACGRLFAMADPSVFINLMLSFGGNRELARGLVQYLVEDDSWGRREGKLYIVSNDFSQTGHFAGGAGLERGIEALVDDLQQVLDQVRAEGFPKNIATILASLLTLLVAAWAYRSSGKVYERPLPRYVSETPLVAQGGAAGRAAVLAAPSTDNTLIVLELKAAAEEILRYALRLPPHAGPPAILDSLARTGAVDARAQKVLSGLFAQMAAAEKAILSSENLRVPAESVKHMRDELEPILDQAETYARRSHS